jgi:hypothetical protein
MNELNFASLRASKKLVDNGIVLETEMYWGCQTGTGTPIWKLQLKNCHFLHYEGEDYPEYPAPCFTDVWRELPWVIDNYGLISMNKVDNTTCCGYRKGMAIREPKFESENPTDALIDLLVWLSGEGNDRV